MRPRVSAHGALCGRQAGDMTGVLRYFDQVGDAHADILGGDVVAAETVDGAAIGGEQVRRLGPVPVGQDHRLAAAQGQVRHGVLVAHAAREAEHILHGIGRLVIMPEAAAARGRTERGGMQRDDRLQARFPVGDEMYDLVIVEIGIVPRRLHSIVLAMKRVIASGATDGT